MHFLFLPILFLAVLPHLVAASFPVEGRVLEVVQDLRSLRVKIVSSGEASLPVGEVVDFRVGTGDLEIGYAGRLVSGDAAYYSNRWHLEKIFPVDGPGAKAMMDVNKVFRDATVALSRRQYIRVGDYLPNFAMINQNGDFIQVRSLRGNPFIVNFIFTRCTVPTMCPASSERMSALQSRAREADLEDLHFVTITFDPEFDSPGILRQYAKGYGFDTSNFHLLTGPRQLIDDLLRHFGILTREEDGTINHTMATLLVDSKGRVAFRKEGATWSVDEFLAEAEKLLRN